MESEFVILRRRFWRRKPALSEAEGDLSVSREHSRVLYRPFWKLLVPAPWYSGRVLLIGDAAHATTPHLASGAGIGVEDAVVIAQELSKASSINDALNRFMDRRFERCRVVVENSVRLGDLERQGGSKEVHQQLMREAMATLLAPI